MGAKKGSICSYKNHWGVWQFNFKRMGGKKKVHRPKVIGQKSYALSYHSQGLADQYLDILQSHLFGRVESY